MDINKWLAMPTNLTSTPQFLQVVLGGAPTLGPIAATDMPATVFLKDSDQTLSDGVDITVGSTTGTKIGTATTQKLAFFNSTPVVQPLVTADLLDSLQALGIIASGAGNTPLDLTDGAVICGALTASGASLLNGDVTLGDAAGDTVTFTGTMAATGFAIRDSGLTFSSSADGKLTISSDGVGTDDITLDGTVTAVDTITPTRGVAAAGGFSVAPRLIHTGGIPAQASTDGTELTAVVTELYVSEVFVPANCTITGAAVFWGTTTSGNAKVMLFDSAGTRVAISASTDVSSYTADTYGSNIAFSAPYAALGPATYYVGVICDDNTNIINTHTLGVFGADKVTGLVYATEAGYATITPPTTFTTGLGPIATLY